jgi:phenylacetate-CoA ligase
MEKFRDKFKDFYLEESPVWFKTIFGTALSLIPQKFRYGPEFSRFRRLLRSSQWWTEERLAQYQMEELKRLLEHAYQNVPYYKKLFDGVRFHPQDFKDFSDLKKIPFLTKQLIRENLDSLVAKNLPPSELVETNTGGSTGEPMVFFRERSKTSPREKAFMFQQWERVGFVVGDRIAVLRGPVPQREKTFAFDPFLNSLVLSSFKLSQETVIEYVGAMNKYKPKFLHVYPSTGWLLAKLMEEQNLRFDYQLKAVLCGSEKLFKSHRDLMRRVFKCRIFSWYGHSEYTVLAGECENSEDYHVFPEYGYTEFVKANHKFDDIQEKVYEVVATGFNNYAFPFIRYKTGDYGILKKGYCDRCFRQYPLIKEIVGREQDYVVTEDGRLISLTALIFGQHLKSFSKTTKMQIEQREIGKIIVKIISSTTFSKEDEIEMKQVMQRCVGNGLNTTFEYPHDIEPTRSGKHPFLKQYLNLNSLNQKRRTNETGVTK